MQTVAIAIAQAWARAQWRSAEGHGGSGRLEPGARETNPKLRPIAAPRQSLYSNSNS